MAIRAANIKGIQIEDSGGRDRDFIALVTFDLLTVPYSGPGGDTITLGTNGFENGILTTLTLAQIIANRRRDGRIITLDQVMGGWAGRQLAATNGPDFYAQAPTIAAGNVVGVTLQSAPVGGSLITTTTSPWDIPATLILLFSAPPLS